MVEAGVGQGQAQGVLPVDPAPHGIGGLTVGQALQVLQDGGQGEHRRGRRGLAELGEQAGKLAVLVDRAERVGNVEAEGSLGESGAGDAAGLFRRRGRVFRMERHRSAHKGYGTDPEYR